MDGVLIPLLPWGLISCPALSWFSVLGASLGHSSRSGASPWGRTSKVPAEPHLKFWDRLSLDEWLREVERKQDVCSGAPWAELEPVGERALDPAVFQGLGVTMLGRVWMALPSGVIKSLSEKAIPFQFLHLF